MKIVEQTAQKLTLKLRPWSYWLFGGFAMAIGAIPTLIIGNQSFTCDRTTQMCQIERSTLWGRTSEEFAPDSLEKAELDMSRDSDGDTTYRVLLHTQNGTVPLTTYYRSGRSGANRNVQAINAFIENSDRPSLQIRQNGQWMGLLFGGIFILGGGTLAFGAGKIVTCDFDKLARQFTLKRRGVFGTQTIQHPLHQIKGCILERSRNRKGSGYSYRVSLVLQSGDVEPLTTYFNSGHDHHAKLETTIRSFLQLDPVSASSLESSRSSDFSSEAISALSHQPLLKSDQLNGQANYQGLSPDPHVMTDTMRTDPHKQDVAIAEYRNRVRLQPNEARLHLNLAFVLQLQGQDKEALMVLESARNRFLHQGDQLQALQMAQAIYDLGLTVKA